MRAFHYLTIFILFWNCTSVTFQEPKDRSPSNVPLGPCSNLIEDILAKDTANPKRSFVEKHLNPILKNLGDLSLEARLGFLKLLRPQAGKRKRISEMYASTLNQMLIRDQVARTEIPELIETKDTSKYLFDFTHDQVKVIERELLDYPNLDQTIDKITARLSPEFATDVKELREVLNKAELGPRALKEFEKYFLKYPSNEKEWKTFDEYFRYVASLRDSQQIKAIKELTSILDSTGKGKHARSFRKIQNSIQKYEEKQYKKFEKKARKLNKNEAEVKAYARLNSRRISEVYGGLRYACRSARPTETSKLAAKKTAKFFMAMGLTATAGTYAYANWDKDKSRFEWYAILGHDILWSFIFQYGYSAIMTGQGATFLQKNLNLHLFYTPADAIEAAMFDQVFGEEKTYLEEEYQRMLTMRKANDPKFLETYNEAMNAFNQPQFMDHLRHFAAQTFSGVIPAEPNEFDEILSLEEISAAELEDEEMKERLLEAIALKVYLAESGNVKMGSQFLDRYLFVRTFDVFNVPKSLLTGIWIYRIMCMSGMGLHQAIIKSSLIFTIDRIITRFIYYSLRRDAINM